LAKSLYEISEADLKIWLKDNGFKTFRSKQIIDWIFKKFILNPCDMLNIPKKLQNALNNEFICNSAKIEKIQCASDGTEKLLISYSGTNDAVECVIIPSAKRITFCLSTQIGCPVKCTFCASGQHGLQRNLSAGEILEQLLLCSKAINAKPDNIVFMGVGEPMLNIKNLIIALDFISGTDYFALGQRHITISTSGIVNGILKLANLKRQYNLAVSLHAPNDALRERIIPSELRANIKDILEACVEYRAQTTRMVTLEYILIKNLNNSYKNAIELAKLAKEYYTKINIIPYNKVDEVSYLPPTEKDITSFINILEENGAKVTRRIKRGDDSDAACGQLRNRNILSREPKPKL
jgi:23S rRNA (adenine2503-C2)-methyltransferase